MNNRKIRVMIVDDSLVFREVIALGISSNPLIEVIATAGDPFEARDCLYRFKPDVITCDVEMPHMNGIEFVRRLLPQYPVPVVMVSAVNEAVFDALNAGAVDFVVKPELRRPQGIEAFINELIGKIVMASQAQMSAKLRPAVMGAARGGTDHSGGQLIAIGASTGGTEAIISILKALPLTMPGIAVVQHIPPVFSRLFAERIQNQTAFLAKEAENGDYLGPGQVLVAPGDRHMRIKKVGSLYKVECFHGEKRNGHCPSVDVLFESAAEAADRRGIGILLTGMGRDGAQGLGEMRRRGARTIGQDADSSVVYGMPKAAFELGAVEKQAALSRIPQLLADMLN